MIETSRLVFDGVVAAFVGEPEYEAFLAAGPGAPQEYLRFFPGDGYAQALADAQRAFHTGANAPLGEAAACAFVCWVGSSAPVANQVDVAPETSHLFAEYVRDVLPELLGDRARAALSMQGGWRGVSGSGRFIFGHLAREALEALPSRLEHDGARCANQHFWGWDEQFLMLLHDALAQWPEGRDLLFVPHFVEIGPRPEMSPLSLISLLRTAWNTSATDLRLEVDQPPMVRHEGVWEPLPFDPLTPSDLRRMTASVLSDAELDRFERTDFVLAAFGIKNACRVRATFRYADGKTNATFHLLPATPPSPSPALEHVFSQRRGLVVFVGPENSGRTTHLMALANALMKQGRSVFCIGDVLELPLDQSGDGDWTAIELRPSVDGTFEVPLEELVAQLEGLQPEVLVIDSIDRADKREAALEAANRRLVLTTQTNDQPVPAGAACFDVTSAAVSGRRR